MGLRVGHDMLTTENEHCCGHAGDTPPTECKTQYADHLKPYNVVCMRTLPHLHPSLQLLPLPEQINCPLDIVQLM